MRRLIRLIPTLMDFAIVYFIVLVIWANSPELGQPGVASDGLSGPIFWVLVFLCVTILYNALADMLLDGRSIGKWALGFVPVGLDGGPTTKGQHLQRFAFKLVGLCLFRGSRDEPVPLHDKKAGIAFISHMMLPQPPSASGWTLRIMNGSLAGKAVALDRLPRFQATGVVHVGRDRDWADVPITDDGVSRRHARIQVCRHGLLLADLNSSNGTVVAGQRLVPQKPVTLRSKTQVRIGPVVVVLEPR